MKNQDVNILFTVGPNALRPMFWSEQAQKKAAELGFTVNFNPHDGAVPTETWADMLEGVDALITTWGAPRLTDEVLAKADRLKIVGNAAGSVGGIVCPEFWARDIPILTANDIMARTVAEWCLMTTMVMWIRMLDYSGIGAHKDMTWSDRNLVRGMQDATISVWGYGAISSRLIELLKPLGPKEILVYSGHLSEEKAREVGVTLCDFDDLFARGDVVHLLGALTEKNVGKVAAKQLASMKDGSVLIQAGRAMLADEDDLLEELKKNRITAVLDVHYAEPLPEDSPFRGLPNVVLTPHTAGHGRESEYVPHVLEEFDRFFRGEPMVSQVSPDRAAMMTDQAHWKRKKK